MMDEIKTIRICGMMKKNAIRFVKKRRLNERLLCVAFGKSVISGNEERKDQQGR